MSDHDSAKININLKKTHCPQCKARMPILRIPKSLKEMFLGGWTCRKCNCKIDKFGKKITE